MANTNLADFYCTKCGKFIVKAMPGATVRCTNRFSKISSVCAGKGKEKPKEEIENTGVIGGVVLEIPVISDPPPNRELQENQVPKLSTKKVRKKFRKK